MSCNNVNFEHPFDLNVSSGALSPSYKQVYKFGQNAVVGNSMETIWQQGGLYSYPPSASTMTVSSSDVNDTSAGTGARTVLISGLNASYNEASETIILNGQTAVTTVNTYIRMNRAIQGIVEQLNSTYLQELKEDTERYAWFKGGNNGGDC